MKKNNYLAFLALILLSYSCVEPVPDSLFCDGGDCPVTPKKEIPGVQVSIPQDNYTKEDGTLITIEVVLKSKPQKEVVIELFSDDESEAEVTPSFLSFSPQNWSQKQTFRVKGLADYQIDGHINYQVLLRIDKEQSDPDYHAVTIPALSFVNIDVDQASLVVSPLSSDTTSEAGGQSTFTIVLSSRPDQTVTIPILSLSPDEATISPAEISFNENNWNRPQKITITGENDGVSDGNQKYQVKIGPTITNGNDYKNISYPLLGLTNIDNYQSPYRHFDINHVLSTGQSNSVANSAHNIISNSQPYNNLMFDVGVMTAFVCDGNGCKNYEGPNSLVPLKEGDRYFNSDPLVGRETMSSGMANQISQLANTDYASYLANQEHQVLVSLHGRSGNSYYCLRKNGCNWWGTTYQRPFEEGMKQVQDALRLAQQMGKSYVVRAVTTIHGETDHYSPLFPHEGSNGATLKIKNYADALIEWQEDYESSVKAINGQNEPISLYVLQMQGWTDRVNSDIPIKQFEAHMRTLNHGPSQGKVILVAPGYMLPFANDCLHYTSASQKLAGEYFAKAYASTVFSGKDWEPLRPINATRTGNKIVIKYLVPVPPLVIDTTAVTNPGNFGFQFSEDGQGTAAISSVQLTGQDEISIWLTSTPQGNNKKIRYAVTAPLPACPGPTNGARGNLRDSDNTSARSNKPLYNWSVGFEMSVN